MSLTSFPAYIIVSFLFFRAQWRIRVAFRLTRNIYIRDVDFLISKCQLRNHFSWVRFLLLRWRSTMNAVIVVYAFFSSIFISAQCVSHVFIILCHGFRWIRNFVYYILCEVDFFLILWKVRKVSTGEKIFKVVRFRQIFVCRRSCLWRDRLHLRIRKWTWHVFEILIVCLLEFEYIMDSVKLYFTFVNSESNYETDKANCVFVRKLVLVIL